MRSEKGHNRTHASQRQPHSITPSARASSDGGRASPRALAVLLSNSLLRECETFVIGGCGKLVGRSHLGFGCALECGVGFRQ
jgi:hypothetical protein